MLHEHVKNTKKDLFHWSGSLRSPKSAQQLHLHQNDLLTCNFLFAVAWQGADGVRGLKGNKGEKVRTHRQKKMGFVEPLQLKMKPAMLKMGV